MLPVSRTAARSAPGWRNWGGTAACTPNQVLHPASAAEIAAIAFTNKALLYDLLFKTAGGNSLTRGNPIERAWRDAHAGSVHVANEPERALALYGRGAFGLPVEDNLV